MLHTAYHWQFRRGKQALLDIWPSQYKYRIVNAKHAPQTVLTWPTLVDHVHQKLEAITAAVANPPRPARDRAQRVEVASTEFLLDPPDDVRLLLHTERGVITYKLRESAYELLRRVRALYDALPDEEDEDRAFYDEDDDDK